MRQLVAAVLITGVLVPAVAQDAPRSYDMETVLRMALGTNETVEQAREDVRTAELLRRAAWNAFLPDASLSGTLTRNDSEISFPFGEGDDQMIITIQNAWDYSGALTVSSPIYQGGFLIKSVEQSGINIGINQDVLSQTQLNLIFQVSAAYAQVVKAQRQVEIARVNLELALRQQKQANILFDAGEAVRSSVLRADAQVADAEAGHIRAQNTWKRAKEDLRLLVNMDGDFSLADPPAPALPVSEPDSLVELAMEKRIELIALDKQLQFNQLQIEKEGSARLPHLDWAFTYVKQRAGFPTNSFWNVSLNASWKLWDSGLSSIMKAQQQAERRKLKLSDQLLRRQIRSDVTKAWLDYQDVQRGLVSADKLLAAARLAFEDVELFFNAGEATDLDLQDARKQLIDAEILKTNLETDKKLALYRLRAAIGLPAVELSGDWNNE